MIGSLQLFANALRDFPDIRLAMVHYKINASRTAKESPYSQDSGFIYNYSDSCPEAVSKLDDYAGSKLIENSRSFETESYKALKFIAEEVPINPTRKTSIITITDSYSDEVANIKELIGTEVNKIKNKSRNPPLTGTPNARFFCINIDAQHTGNDEIIEEEYAALADGEMNFRTTDFNHTVDTLLRILNDSNILCLGQGKRFKVEVKYRYSVPLG